MTQKQSASTSTRTNFFKLPAPLRQLFDTFPLLTYDENALPQRLKRDTRQHRLYIFTYPPSTSKSSLSPNPACLKWQAYLLAKQITFKTIPSNNHASPSGALPYLEPASSSDEEPESAPITSSKLQRWVENQTGTVDEQDIRLDAYSALIDHNIRNAWLYYMYLNEKNLEAVAEQIYITPISRSRFVKSTLRYQLRQAAKEQLQRTTLTLDEDDILESAVTAFQSLNTLLGDDTFFSRKGVPGLFDCALFAYTQPLLALHDSRNTASITWADDILVQKILPYEAIVRHVQNMLRVCGSTTS